MALSIYPCFAYPTVLAAVFMMITGIVYYLATHFNVSTVRGHQCTAGSGLMNGCRLSGNGRRW
jgi:hypothetical protein